MDEASNLSTFDLYADIIEDNFHQKQGSYKELDEKYKAVKTEVKELTDQLDELTNSSKLLQTENNNLKKNISSLLLTAKAEISRKDQEIRRLRCCLESRQRRRHQSRLPRKSYRDQLSRSNEFDDSQTADTFDSTVGVDVPSAGLGFSKYRLGKDHINDHHEGRESSQLKEAQRKQSANERNCGSLSSKAIDDFVSKVRKDSSADVKSDDRVGIKRKSDVTTGRYGRKKEACASKPKDKSIDVSRGRLEGRQVKRQKNIKTSRKTRHDDDVETNRSYRQKQEKENFSSRSRKRRHTSESPQSRKRPKSTQKSTKRSKPQSSPLSKYIKHSPVSSSTPKLRSVAKITTDSENVASKSETIKNERNLSDKNCAAVKELSKPFENVGLYKEGRKNVKKDTHSEATQENEASKCQAIANERNLKKKCNAVKELSKPSENVGLDKTDRKNGNKDTHLETKLENLASIETKNCTAGTELSKPSENVELDKEDRRAVKKDALSEATQENFSSKFHTKEIERNLNIKNFSPGTELSKSSENAGLDKEDRRNVKKNTHLVATQDFESETEVIGEEILPPEVNNDTGIRNQGSKEIVYSTVVFRNAPDSENSFCGEDLHVELHQDSASRVNHVETGNTNVEKTVAKEVSKQTMMKEEQKISDEVPTSILTKWNDDHAAGRKNSANVMEFVHVETKMIIDISSGSEIREAVKDEALCKSLNCELLLDSESKACLPSESIASVPSSVTVMSSELKSESSSSVNSAVDSCSSADLSKGQRNCFQRQSSVCTVTSATLWESSNGVTTWVQDIEYVDGVRKFRLKPVSSTESLTSSSRESFKSSPTPSPRKMTAEGVEETKDTSKSPLKNVKKSLRRLELVQQCRTRPDLVPGVSPFKTPSSSMSLDKITEKENDNISTSRNSFNNSGEERKNSEEKPSEKTKTGKSLEAHGRRENLEINNDNTDKAVKSSVSANSPILVTSESQLIENSIEEKSKMPSERKIESSKSSHDTRKHNNKYDNDHCYRDKTKRSTERNRTSNSSRCEAKSTQSPEKNYRKSKISPEIVEAASESLMSIPDDVYVFIGEECTPDPAAKERSVKNDSFEENVSNGSVSGEEDSAEDTTAMLDETLTGVDGNDLDKSEHHRDTDIEGTSKRMQGGFSKEMTDEASGELYKRESFPPATIKGPTKGNTDMDCLVSTCEADSSLDLPLSSKDRMQSVERCISSDEKVHTTIQDDHLSLDGKPPLVESTSVTESLEEGELSSDSDDCCPAQEPLQSLNKVHNSVLPASLSTNDLRLKLKSGDHNAEKGKTNSCSGEKYAKGDTVGKRSSDSRRYFQTSEDDSRYLQKRSSRCYKMDEHTAKNRERRNNRCDSRSESPLQCPRGGTSPKCSSRRRPSCDCEGCNSCHNRDRGGSCSSDRSTPSQTSAPSCDTKTGRGECFCHRCTSSISRRELRMHSPECSYRGGSKRHGVDKSSCQAESSRQRPKSSSSHTVERTSRSSSPRKGLARREPSKHAASKHLGGCSCCGKSDRRADRRVTSREYSKTTCISRRRHRSPDMRSSKEKNDERQKYSPANSAKCSSSKAADRNSPRNKSERVRDEKRLRVAEDRSCHS